MKTYLTPEAQWEKTATYAVEELGLAGENGLGRRWYLGQIVQTHRLFKPGDYVVVQLANGQGCRQTVTAVSSKGYRVREMYLGYAEHSCGPYRGRHQVRLGRFLSSKTGHTVVRSRRKRCHRALREGWFGQGPFRFVETPEHLAGLQPDAPPVRQYIVALAREGWRKPGKRE